MTARDLLLTTQQWCLALLLSRSDGNYQITSLAAIMVWAEVLYLHGRVVLHVQTACPPNLPSNHPLGQNKPRDLPTVFAGSRPLISAVFRQFRPD